MTNRTIYVTFLKAEHKYFRFWVRYTKRQGRICTLIWDQPQYNCIFHTEVGEPQLKVNNMGSREPFFFDN